MRKFLKDKSYTFLFALLLAILLAFWFFVGNVFAESIDYSDDFDSYSVTSDWTGGGNWTTINGVTAFSGGSATRLMDIVSTGCPSGNCVKTKQNTTTPYFQGYYKRITDDEATEFDFTFDVYVSTGDWRDFFFMLSPDTFDVGSTKSFTLHTQSKILKGETNVFHLYCSNGDIKLDVSNSVYTDENLYTYLMGQYGYICGDYPYFAFRTYHRYANDVNLYFDNLIDNNYNPIPPDDLETPILSINETFPILLKIDDGDYLKYNKIQCAKDNYLLSFDMNNLLDYFDDNSITYDTVEIYRQDFTNMAWSLYDTIEPANITNGIYTISNYDNTDYQYFNFFFRFENSNIRVYWDIYLDFQYLDEKCDIDEIGLETDFFDNSLYIPHLYKSFATADDLFPIGFFTIFFSRALDWVSSNPYDFNYTNRIRGLSLLGGSFTHISGNSGGTAIKTDIDFDFPSIVIDKFDTDLISTIRGIFYIPVFLVFLYAGYKMLKNILL